MTKELKLKFIVNGKEVPVNGKPEYITIDDSKWKIKMQVGTTKLDSIEILFDEVTYVDEIKPKRKSKAKPKNE